MPTIHFHCPKCAVLLETDDALSGGVAECPQCGASVMIPMPGIAPGVEIAGYTIERKLGAGGMGEVWLATQKAMERKVALKILSPAMSRSAVFISQFMAEVKNSAKLLHPNIVTAFDAGVDKGTYYLAISYVEGVVLDDMLVKGSFLPEKQVLAIGRQMAEALRYAWDECKILHRDIKPANIMLDTKGNAKLMDMGVSKSLSEDQMLTQAGLIVGTPYYMSPEQARGESKIDFRSDIYALGATLYHAVTGTVPYDAESTVGLLTKHVTDAFPSPIERNPAVSEPCAVLLEIMMAKSPDERQQSWGAVTLDIDLVASGKFPATKKPDPFNTQVMKRLSDHPAIQALIQKDIPKARLGKMLASKTTHLHIDKLDDFPPGFANLLPRLKLILPLAAVLLALVVAVVYYMKHERSTKATAERQWQEKLSQAKETVKAQEVADSLAAEKMRLEQEKLKHEWKQAEKTAQEEKLKELYDVAADFAGKAMHNQTDLAIAVSNFDKIKEQIKNTKYELMAHTEKAKLTALINKLAQEKEQAEVKAEKERIEKEKLRIETEMRLAEEKRKAAQEKLRLEIQSKLIEEKRKTETVTERRRDDLLADVAADLLAGNGKAASDKIDAQSDKVAIADVRDIVAKMANADSLVRNSFISEIGQEVTIEMADGKKERLRVKAIEGQQIVFETDKAKSVRKISPKELSDQERYQRLSKLEPSARAVFLVINDLKNEKYNVAKVHAEDTGALAKPIARQVEILRLAKAQEEAKKDFEKILRLAGCAPDAAAAPTTIPEDKRKDVLDAIADFKAKHDDTPLAKENEKLLAALVELASGKNRPTTPAAPPK